MLYEIIPNGVINNTANNLIDATDALLTGNLGYLNGRKIGTTAIRPDCEGGVTLRSTMIIPPESQIIWVCSIVRRFIL